jgi:5'-methylthioadenosine phosphorylase
LKLSGARTIFIFISQEHTEVATDVPASRLWLLHTGRVSLLAFVGGTGFDLRGPDSPFDSPYDAQIETRFGPASLTRAFLDDLEIVFLHRHARPDEPSIKDVPPHRVNYRANIAALKKIGVTGIFASTAVGSLRREWTPGTLVCLDNFFDLTTNRAKTFFDARAVHADFTLPYCADLRQLLLDAGRREGIELKDGGVYAGMDGPRFETAAEIKMLQILGADVVGMTGTTEAILAREAEISYAGVSIATNLAAGISDQPLTQEEVLDAMHLALPRLGRLFLSAARMYQDDPNRPSRRTTREFASPDYDPTSEVI